MLFVATNLCCVHFPLMIPVPVIGHDVIVIVCLSHVVQLPASRDEKKTPTHVETLALTVQAKSRRRRKVRHVLSCLSFHLMAQL